MHHSARTAQNIHGEHQPGGDVDRDRRRYRSRVDSPGSPGSPGSPDEGDRPSARDLVRRRRGDYRAAETGRHHHIGAAPERQPLLSPDGVAGDGAPQYVEAAAVQLAERTVAQLTRQRDQTRERMAQAALALDFEGAALLRDALAAVEVELERRGTAPGGQPVQQPG